jgi:hypothetical protein
MAVLEQSAEAKRREAAIEFARNQVMTSNINTNSAIPTSLSTSPLSPGRKSPLSATAGSGVFSSGGGGGGGEVVLDQEEEKRSRLLNVGTTFGSASQQDSLVRLFRQLLFNEEVIKHC